MAEPRYPLLSLSRHRLGVDGEGVTTLVAGAGCPLRCEYCINKRFLAEKTPKMVDVSELFERTKIDDLYFRATNGGLCFGGGESLLHADFLAAFREISPWRITCETSLAVPRSAVETAARCVDDFIVDCKSFDPGVYRRYTGGDEAVFEENLRFLVEKIGPGRLHVRVPRIPNYNDAADQRRSAGILRSLGITRVELFNYVIRK